MTEISTGLLIALLILSQGIGVLIGMTYGFLQGWRAKEYRVEKK